MSRLERRPFRNPTDGTERTPFRPSNAHYHLNVDCIKAADPSFISTSLVIPDSVRLELGPAHWDKLFVELGINVLLS